MRKQRTNWSAEEKVMILRRHFIDDESVSDLCEKLGIHPNVFYRWQKEFLENGAEAFRKRPDGKVKKLEEKISFLEDKLSKKNEVLCELMEEHMALKKSLGEI